MLRVYEWLRRWRSLDRFAGKQKNKLNDESENELEN